MTTTTSILEPQVDLYAVVVTYSPDWPQTLALIEALEKQHTVFLGGAYDCRRQWLPRSHDRPPNRKEPPKNTVAA